MAKTKMGGILQECRPSIAEPFDHRERSKKTVGAASDLVNGKSFDMERVIAAVHNIRKLGGSVTPVIGNGPWNHWTPATLFHVDDFDSVGVLFVIEYAERLQAERPR